MPATKRSAASNTGFFQPHRPDRLLRVDELMSRTSKDTAGKPRKQSASADDLQRPGHLFKPGQSGNPKGRQRGSRNQATLAVEALLDGEAELLTRKAIEIAKEGDMQALRLCLDRIVPPRKDRPVNFELPPITCAGDAAKASAALVAAVSIGQITPSEAVEVVPLVVV